jgi:uncharacterized protein (TIGR03118 family)
MANAWRQTRLTLAVQGLMGIASLLAATELRAGPVVQTDLVSDQSGVAQIQDPNLVNPWGMSFSAGSPFWVSNNGTGTSTLYTVNALDVVAKSGLTVTIPGDGTVTGQVNTSGGLFNPFNKDSFLFVSEDGTISGWRGALGTSAEVLQTADPANVYKGSAFANTGGHSYLYAANFRNGTIDVLKGDSGAPSLTGTFSDPTLPSGFAPFNIEKIGNFLFVTYAKQDAAKHDEEAGTGLGIVSKFDLNGNFLGRVGSQGTLNAPWGMTIAPTSFGALAGDLLVGNFGDGRISAFNLSTNTLDGQLTDPTGAVLSIDGLWALSTGNGGSAGSSMQRVFFTAGPDGESHGLFGSLSAVPEPSTMGPAGLAALAGAGYTWRRRRRAAA